MSDIKLFKINKQQSAFRGDLSGVGVDEVLEGIE